MRSSLACSQKLLRTTPLLPILARAHYNTIPPFSTPSTTPHNDMQFQNPQLEELRPVFRTTFTSHNGSGTFHPTSNRDWRDHFLANFNVRIVMNNKKVESFLYDWRYDWSCFWEELDPLDPNKDYVFKKPLELWECGFVHSPHHFDEFGDDINYNELCSDFTKMTELKKLIHNYEGSQWHPAGYPLFPIIIKFDKTKEVTPKNVLKALLAHELVQQDESINNHHITDMLNVIQTKKIAEANQAIENWFKQYFGESYVAFQAGSQSLNPVPWICVGKTKTGNLVGIISALDIPQEHKVINWG